MKKLLTILFLFLMVGNGYCATEFKVTVMPSGGDYTALETAVNANECDLTAARVLSHSGITGTIPDGSTVTGATSSATGTVEHVTATQILISGITGTFQNGEKIYKDVDTNYVMATSAPDSVQLSVEIDGTWSSADTSAVTIHNYTTSETCYINIYTTATARHKGTYPSNTYYRLETSINGGGGVFFISGLYYVRATGLAIKNTSTNTSVYASGIFTNNSNYTASDIRIDKCVVKTLGGPGIRLQAEVDGWLVKNSIFISAGQAGISFIGTYGGTHTQQKFYNCIGISLTNYYGIHNSKTSWNYRQEGIINCYAYSNGENSDYAGEIYPTTSASSDGSQSTSTVAYSTDNFTNVTAGSEDFHLVAGSDLIDVGTDLSSTFTDDIDGNTRSGTWDIGADEYVNPIQTNLIFNNSIFNNVQLN